ncbi:MULTISPECIES: hormogonium polysaccharide biosynthesis protein HpsA [unclassified Leptolyngbya]|uniref:hormogonium polysaccharide biosynthesis protein HpsA n=1 Tax=unclassified Leptolyngbya TaxID=2650499 RepID=UPI0016860B94|nr:MULTISPECIES: hormogonium polysaccharide biosynthesis protein HpsA [unclassified Leptolyngbya]MBD1911291.1 hypothetical protein [Leptolyngbya sp. FACHB-8]MBD2156691.1 hypothetical protein [Leptolyngbya sp. FACHB-16]
MSTRKFIRAIQATSSQFSRVVANLTRSLMQGLLRGLLSLGRQPAYGRSGFVLPTTVLLIMVVLLTVGSIVFRTYNRTTETISERQQRVIYNAATPAVDRARAKLEFLFDKEREVRYPGGVPSENVLLGLMLNGATIGSTTIPAFPGGPDPYTFRDEQRINIGTSYPGDAGPDNAWRYRADTDGDGTPDATVVYSIAMRLDAANQLSNATNQRISARASSLLVRNTPLSAATQGNPLCATNTGAVLPQQGWIPGENNTSKLFKTFQVDAYVLPDRQGQSIATLEMQMDRQIDRGNKWGAWFRNDLEIYPGAPFNWNGAMHTEGSLMVANTNFTAYMISDPDSCLYTEDASEITVAKYPADGTYGPFRGEFIAGSMRDDTGSGTSRFDGTGYFHLWDGVRRNPIGANANPPPAVARLTPGDQSVAPAPGAGPTDYALDPVVMQTKGISQHRTPTVVNTPRPASWENGQKALLRLITPDNATQVPLVDDTFRADNRYGPKPKYGDLDLPPGSYGTEIPSTDLKLISDSPGSGESAEAVGLDGYWERRARVEGLRLIVGQRLELGDPAGWGGPILKAGDPSDLDREALRPFQTCSDVANAPNGNRCSEARQRRALWDNLAAVQAMAVYHASSGDLDRPVACMASTVHPGTAGTLERSSTFENLALGLPASAFGTGNEYLEANTPIISNFFQGRGTNGWEFEFKDTYLADYNNPNSALRIALRNLAQYAGDPLGGAPSFTPVQDRLGVHPFPSMAMWGDFSTLRRALNLIEPTSLNGEGRSYASLSPADKTTLHTATCMLGMLAYNLDYLAKFNPSAPALQPIMGTAYANRAAENAARDANPAQYYSGLRGALRALVVGTSPLGAVEGINDAILTDVVDPNGSTSTRFIGAGVDDAIGGSKVNQPDTYIRLLERWRDATPATGAGPAIGTSGVAPTRAQLNQYIALAQLIATKEQVARDRSWGFYKATDPATAAETLSRDHASITGQGISGTYGPLTNPVEGCYGMRGSTGNGGVGDSIRFLCSWRPRYPILFSLFPAEGFANSPFRASHGDVDQPFANGGAQFTRDAVDSDSAGESQTYIATVNAGRRYQVITQAQMASLISNPRPNPASWRLPIGTAANPGGGTPLSPTDTLIKVCFNNATVENQVCLARSSGFGAPTSSTSGPGNQTVTGEQYLRVPFKDSAFFNGREMMNVRALDVNLNFIRQETRSLTGDTWLPKSGIVYAFREDAVSENNIVRRKSANVDWEDCNTEVNLRTNTNCRMFVSTSAFASVDPPLAENLISAKPVDYYADPDRRPNGFRLRQGEDLRRTGDDGRGLSFISDNPVYIQGSFNLHNSATNPAEEFEQPAGDNFANFYGRSTFNGAFASIDGDSWRPSEVVADGITILSNAFCDGSVYDGLTDTYNRTRYNCNGTTSSYQNQNIPQSIPNGASPVTPGLRWTHAYVADGLGYAANASDTNYREGDSPFYISPNGNPWRALPINAQAQEPIYNGAYVNFTEDKNPTRPGPFCGQRVNAIIVSGLVPSRAGNSYGGLHNFPRFLEDWTNCNLFISGSLIQLNFSTYATGPYDQDAWEVGSTPTPGGSLPREGIAYYDAPNRIWGYDVGLQYAPAGPVARRFTSLSPTRNEFYSEPPADDAYMTTLLSGVCASNPSPRPARCQS